MTQDEIDRRIIAPARNNVAQPPRTTGTAGGFWDTKPTKSRKIYLKNLKNASKYIDTSPTYMIYFARRLRSTPTNNNGATPGKGAVLQ